jgi:hypothetical protein
MKAIGKDLPSSDAQAPGPLEATTLDNQLEATTLDNYSRT